MEEHKKNEHEFQDEFKHHLGDAAKTFDDMTHAKKFNFKEEFMNAIEVIKLRSAKINSVSINKNASLAAIIFVLIAIVAANLGNYFDYFRFGLHTTMLNNLFITAIITFAAFLISVFAYDFVGSYLFNGKKSFRELFRVLGYGYLIMAISIISVLAFVAGIWYLIITYKSLVNVKKLNPTNAILTILLGIISVSVVFFIISLIIGGPVLQYYGLSASGLNY
jgi:hypothetical protein